jgi:hypothetical protein
MIINICARKILLVVFVLSLFPLSLFPSTAFPVEIMRYEGLELEFIGNLSLTYTDNYSFEEDDDKDGELFTSMSLSMNLKHEGRRQDFSLGGSIHLWLRDFDIGNDNERVSEEVHFEYNRELSRYSSVRLYDDYSHTRFPVSFEEEFGRTGTEAELDDYENTFGLGYYYLRDFGTYTAGAGYDYLIHSTSGDTYIDSKEHRIHSRLGYNLGATSSVYLSYAYSARDFSGEDTIYIHSLGAGFYMRRPITKKTYFEGSIGISTTSLSLEDKTVTGSALLVSNIDKKTDGRLLFERVLSTTNNADIFRSWRFEGDINRKLLRDLWGYLSGFVGEGEYLSTGTEERIYGVSLETRYSLNRYLNVVFGYRYSKLDTKGDKRGYARSTISGGVNLSF